MSSVFNPSVANINNTSSIAIYAANSENLTGIFVNQTGDVMTGNLIFQGNDTKIIFPDGSSQSSAFDESRKEQLSNLIELTGNLTLIDEKLIVNQDVEFMGSVEVPDNSFQISSIQNLASNLTTLTNLVNNSNSNITNLLVSVAALNNLNIQTQFDTQGALISVLTTNLNNIINTVVHNSEVIQQNLNSITINYNNIDLLNNSLTGIITDLATKQVSINLNIANIQAILQTLSEQEQIITNLSNEMEALDNEMDNIATQSNIEDLNNSISLVQTAITTISTQISSIQTSITNITADVLEISQFKDSQETLNIGYDGDLNELKNFKDEQIVYNSVNDTNISNINSELQTKQNEINLGNKLSSSLIDYSNTPLQYIDSGITTNLSATLSSLSNSIESLLQLQNGDIISFQEIDNNFETLNTFKTLQETYNNTNNNNITELQTFKISQELYNSTNDGDITELKDYNIRH